MNNSNSFAKVLAIVAFLVAVVALVSTFTVSSGKLGDTVVQTQQTDFVNGLKIAGNLTTSMQSGTCNAATALLPLEATTTDAFTCTVTGVAVGDRAFVTLPSYDLSFGELAVSGVTVTANTLTFTIYNGTGAATSSFPLATTSVKYVIYR